MDRSKQAAPGLRTGRLRGTSVLAAPLVLFSVIALSFALASLLWAVGSSQSGPGAVASVVVPTVLGAAALAAIRGCFVDVAPSTEAPAESAAEGVHAGEVRDVVAWRTLRRVPQRSIVAARVRRGVWRLYVLELDDGSLVKLVGASPQQFPAHLLADAARLDMDDLDTLMGPEHS